MLINTCTYNGIKTQAWFTLEADADAEAVDPNPGPSLEAQKSSPMLGLRRIPEIRHAMWKISLSVSYGRCFLMPWPPNL